VSQAVLIAVHVVRRLRLKFSEAAAGGRNAPRRGDGVQMCREISVCPLERCGITSLPSLWGLGFDAYPYTTTAVLHYVISSLRDFFLLETSSPVQLNSLEFGQIFYGTRSHSPGESRIEIEWFRTEWERVFCLSPRNLMVSDGYKFAAAPLLLGAIAVGFHWYWAGGALILLGIFVLYFFRDPERTAPGGPETIVSPADGRVMEVVEESLGGNPGLRISIFLSIFDVHVNRSPVAGRITAIEYRSGKFYAAMRARASAENEQNTFHVSTEHGEVVFKQIAGWVARRILCWKSVGDTVMRGERIGMIRFGSRMDIWLPGRVEILVRPGQQVAAGASALARWK